jgi:hypothetical protein
MAEERTPRSKDTRQEEVRPSDSWVPASILPTPIIGKGGFIVGYEPAL